MVPSHLCSLPSTLSTGGRGSRVQSTGMFLKHMHGAWKEGARVWRWVHDGIPSIFPESLLDPGAAPRCPSLFGALGSPASIFSLFFLTWPLGPLISFVFPTEGTPPLLSLEAMCHSASFGGVPGGARRRSKGLLILCREGRLAHHCLAWGCIAAINFLIARVLSVLSVHYAESLFVLAFSCIIEGPVS